MFSSFMASIYCLGVRKILSMDSAQVGPVRSLSQSPLLFVVVFCQAGPGRALHIALKTDGASCAKNQTRDAKIRGDVYALKCEHKLGMFSSHLKKCS